MDVKIVVLIILLGGMVNAEIILETGVYDLNTKEPLENASVILSLGGIINRTDYTDTSGISIIDNITSETYNIDIDKDGYLVDEYSLAITTSITQTRYLIPISQDGIVRFNGNEINFERGRRLVRVYFKENGRLEGIYQTNDSITLLINREYIIRPEYRKSDMLTGTNTVRGLAPYLLALFAPFIVILIILSLFVIVVAKAWKSR